MNNDLKIVIGRILKDIRIDMGDEFNRNFERQAFFSQSWQRRSSPLRPGGATLVDSGTLRRSIQSQVSNGSIRFFSTLPYAAIHNEGGEIKVTSRMKRYFWYRYYQATGSFGRKKSAEKRQAKRILQLSDEAELCKCRALMRVGKSIRIPKRQFLGT